MSPTRRSRTKQNHNPGTRNVGGRSIHNRSGLDYCNLEPRQMLASVNFANGVLTVFGSPGDDAIVARANETTGVTIVLESNSVIHTQLDPVSQINFYGGPGNDEFINRTALPSQFFGGTGDDSFQGGSGADYAHGGPGADVLNGNQGNDRFRGGDGQDQLSGDAGQDQLFGGGQDDIILGGDDGDYLVGHAGEDILQGESGNDRLAGGAGNDWLYGGANDDHLNAGVGDDTVFGNTGNDRLIGGPGNDRLRSGDGDDTVFGNQGNDAVFAETGNNTIYGGTGADEIEAGDGNNVVRGDAGDDQIRTGNGDDRVFGGDGNDQILSGHGDDLIRGEDGNDRLFTESGSGQNQVFGGSGNDSIFAIVDDFVQGGTGADRFLPAFGNGFYHADQAPEDVLIKVRNLQGFLTPDHLVVIDQVFETLVEATGNNRLLQSPDDPAQGISIHHADFLDGKLAMIDGPRFHRIHVTDWNIDRHRSARINEHFKREFVAELGKIWSTEEALTSFDPVLEGRAGEFLAISSWESSYHSSGNGNLTLDGKWRYDPDTHFFDVRGQLSPLDDFGTTWAHYLFESRGDDDGSASQNAKLHWVEDLFNFLR